ncbi:LPXTG cell wall anchor domain-containing protein [Listeria monocytogenes]|nr:LPXTG cell wall anchor domain-containing protein [Listeria monocytogenes]EAD8589221.1 LPXTG cell wall anchor domain-containing protein [Listeria monocytogenes]EAD8593606.1 LPXTG cell wall anchor domain-containing protein [Listeria monocytogenes]EAD8601584.1 LPXTG cell wall anchor domain-containing protein [Listeria monocytogenes]
MKNRKKRLRQLIIAFVLLYTIGLPMKNIVLANELATNEAVVTEEATINEDEMAASEEAEQPTEEIQEEKESLEESTSAVTATDLSKQPAEEIIESKEEEKEFNQPDGTEKTIKKDVKAISPDKISSIFPDANLAEAIRDTLGKSSVDDVVTQAELDTITLVYKVNSGIADISGMENLTNLSKLILESNHISDISPVANLTNLISLNLNNNQISDISPLANLTSLDELSLGSNDISDISPVASLTNLTLLELFHNQLNDISPLSNLTDLKNLYLHYNHISDISPVANLTNLISLNLNNNHISDISSLSNLTKLYLVYLGNQSISASKVKWNDPLSVTNVIKDLNGNLIAPSSMSDQGAYTDPTITWTGLTNTSQSVSYEWSQAVTIGASTTTFNGTFTLPVEKSVQYNVNFDIDRQVTTELVEAGELVTKPQDPNKDGYAFIGWYDTETGGNKWDFSTDTMPANDMTLYARFNKLGFVTPEIKPSTPGSGGNQPPSNGSDSNTGNMTITSQENTKTSPKASQQSKLAQLGEQNPMLLQGVGLLMVISGIAFFWWKRRKKVHS